MRHLVKTSMCIAALVGAGWVSAQPASGPGPGAGPGPGYGGMGPGRGGMMGPRYGAGVTPGWALMTPEERSAHQNEMRGMKTYDECRAYVDQQHQLMQGRAKERGVAVPATPRRDVCAGLKK